MMFARQDQSNLAKERGSPRFTPFLKFSTGWWRKLLPSTAFPLLKNTIYFIVK